MFKKVLLVLTFILLFSFAAKKLFAQTTCPPGSTYNGASGQCVDDVTRKPVESISEQSPLLGCGGKSINTAIGCIPIEGWNEFVGKILEFALGIAGGIALLLFILSGFMIMTSRGDPKRLSAGQELLTSVIMGLILLIFSVLILKIIGVDILNIPGFTKSGG